MAAKWLIVRDELFGAWVALTLNIPMYGGQTR